MSVDESNLPTAEKPPVSFPHGLFSWDVIGLNNGDSVTISITYPDNIASDSEYWKIIGDTWVDATEILGSNDGDNIITLTIIDGRLGDADGIANGKITDPGGIAIPAVIPHSPSNLVGNVVSSTQIDLSWSSPDNDGGSAVTGYTIERNLNEMGWNVLLAETESDATTYQDKTLQSEDSASYRVSAINSVGTGSPSNEFSATTLDMIPPRIDTITRQIPTTEATSDDTVTLRVTFDEPVTGVEKSDFASIGTAVSLVTGFTKVSDVQYDLHVTVTGDGTVSVSLVSEGHDITDTASTPNSLANTVPKSDQQSYTVTLLDNTPPTVSLSYSKDNPSKKGDDIIITAKFSEPIDESFKPQIAISGSNVLSSTDMKRSDDTICCVS